MAINKGKQLGEEEGKLGPKQALSYYVFWLLQETQTHVDEGQGDCKFFNGDK